MTRLLLDTSVLLSAIAGRPTSPPARLLAGLRDGAGDLLTCPTILRELAAGLEKPYFRRRVTDAEAAEIATAFALLAVLVPEPADPPRVLRDPADDFLVAAARGGEANAIVTGDRDLLDHGGLQPPVLDAAGACALLGL